MIVGIKRDISTLHPLLHEVLLAASIRRVHLHASLQMRTGLPSCARDGCDVRVKLLPRIKFYRLGTPPGNPSPLIHVFKISTRSHWSMTVHERSYRRRTEIHAIYLPKTVMFGK
jgi:hypothetical protein